MGYYLTFYTIHHKIVNLQCLSFLSIPFRSQKKFIPNELFMAGFFAHPYLVIPRGLWSKSTLVTGCKFFTILRNWDFSHTRATMFLLTYTSTNKNEQESNVYKLVHEFPSYFVQWGIVIACSIVFYKILNNINMKAYLGIFVDKVMLTWTYQR